MVVAEPAEVVLLPGSQVYFVADGGPDLFFYAGFWWSPRGDRWFRSRVYNGPWIVVERRHVPVQMDLTFLGGVLFMIWGLVRAAVVMTGAYLISELFRVVTKLAENGSRVSANKDSNILKKMKLMICLTNV